MRNHLLSIGRMIGRASAHFRIDARGVSAVEFALILPAMVALYLGLSEVSQGIGISRKVTLTAHALSDLASNPKAGTTINQSEMTNILNAAAAVIAPYPAAPLAVTVSAVNIDANGKATIGWSKTLGGTERSKDSSITIPSALAVPNSQLILSEATYAYTPAVGYTITGTLTLSDKLYMAPRVGKITWSTS
jgi:Flp pilus assembly protein TadG